MDSDFTTEEMFMSAAGIGDRKTVRRMIAVGELPPFTYGSSRAAKKKGWHKMVLQQHALRRYEKVCSSCQVVGQEVDINFLRGLNRRVTKK